MIELRSALDVALAILLAGAFAAQMVRWLRVLQREHYDPSSMSRFLGRWSSPPVASAKSVERAKRKRPITLSHVLIVVLVVTVVARLNVGVVLVGIAYGLFCPQGLSLKGRTSPLQWTRRLTTIAVVASTASLLVALAGVFTVQPGLLAVAMVWAVPLVLDVTTRALGPYEERRAGNYVDQAKARLARVHPRVVAITGSYGKTSTKNHLADILGREGAVVASPRSFNNRAGLSRAINENLADGTRIFIAEMGTYQPGEIRALCTWCPPEISIVTAIGPVHLERMKSLDVIDRAKFEITELAHTVVLNIDDPHLAKWVDRLTEREKVVCTAGSTNPAASVQVTVDAAQWHLVVDGAAIGSVPAIAGVQVTNLACALAAALALGVGPEDLLGRVARVTAVANRLNVLTAPSGVVVIDDTFNANPASAAAALAALASMPLSGRRVVVTPGLIELGTEQYGSNILLAQKIATMGAELVIVGRTNVPSLTTGYERPLRRFDVRDEAVAWVRSALVGGDGVLYLNDLPDHYP